MKTHASKRRSFLKATAVAGSGMALLSVLPKKSIAGFKAEPKIRFSVININHSHIYGMVNAVIRGGGQLVSVYAKEPDLLAGFVRQFPYVKKAASRQEILEDPSIQVILSSGIPVERAPLGVEVMQHGKDYLVDKPGITTLEQLAEVRKVQKATKRMYYIMFSERFENKATVKAGELVQAGAIGQVMQTIGIGPHRISLSSRPDWFFDKKKFGGIICDIGSHQFDQFLFFTGSTTGEIVASQVANFHHPQYPNFEDFGDVMMRGNGGAGYIRLDWFTPDGLKSWGDGRLTILGTEGYIEVRKNIDITLHDSGNHLYMVNQKEAVHIDCNNLVLPFGEQFVNDVLNRTETSMTQAHCLLATEMALKAQKNAQMIHVTK
ncbi:MAG TPA: Gfo/Idh/MocA family oxidoreductase [Sediminibacterium sp.]|nr:Gfo/Idh/MocA family oxidoreductase [Sediminibacterium sp.]